MSLTNGTRRKFIDAYSKMVLTSWGDDQYAARLRHTPAAAVAEIGIALPPDAVVEIVSVAPDQLAAADGQSGDLDAQVALYEQGLQTGRFVFHVPHTPVLDTGDLDAADLTGVAAGATYCCCCCPACSSCTV